MNPAQKLYDLKSSIIDSNSKILETEYFRIIDNIRARPNLYKIAPEKINLKRNAYEPFKDPDVIKSNRKLQLRIDTIIDEPSLPKLNLEYLDIRQKLRKNRERYRDIAKSVLNTENEKFQDRVFNQKPRIENTIALLKDYELTQTYKSIGRNSRGLKKFYKEKTNVRLPSINKHKVNYDKIFQTEINNTSGNYDTEPNVKDAKELKDHKYSDITHQKPEH